jgi:hypothetical protein
MSEAPPTAYPLQWPPGWPRTKAREAARFKTTLVAALKDLQSEVRLLGGQRLVLSSNVTLGAERPADPGVVAYFQYEQQQVAVPCDRWGTVQDNVRAIALTINAMRGMERWGAKHMIRAMFQGFIALPAPMARDWRQVLGLPTTGEVGANDIEIMFRRKAARLHPDAGGSHAAMAELNAARAQALKEIQGD